MLFWLTLSLGLLPPLLFDNVEPRSDTRFVLRNGEAGNRHLIETMLGGVALLDYDGDGLLDIFLTNGAALPSSKKTGPEYANRLFRNVGDATFRDVTLEAGVSGEGYSMGAAAGDYDNDGRPDLYVAGVNRNILYRNLGNGSFADVTTSSGAHGVHPDFGKRLAVGAGWFDADNDGDLDLFVLQYLDWKAETEPACESYGKRAYCHPDRYRPLPSMLYRNNGNGTFTDVTDVSGIGAHAGKGMSVAFADYDLDGDTDIFVSNDTFRNFLFRSSGDGKFTEVAVLSGVAYNEHGKAIAGMGADFRDVDGDGRADIFQTGMIGDTFPLFHNEGREFSDVTTRSGLAKLTGRLTGWGAGAYDFDNDGWKDLFTANGSILDNAREVENLPYHLPCSIFRSLQGKAFEAAEAGKDLAAPRAHRGAAFGDLNNDGRVDVVTNNIGAAPKILMNRSSHPSHWLLLDLQGTSSNRDGLGARIVVQAGGRSMHNHVTTSVGYNSSSDRRVHFGLGAATKATAVTVHWPSGKVQRLENVAADQILQIREPE